MNTYENLEWTTVRNPLQLWSDSMATIQSGARLVLLCCLVLCGGCGGPSPLPTPGEALEEPGEWNPETYVAYRTDTPIVIDGRLDDAAWMSAVWTSWFVDIEGSGRPAPQFDTRAKMLWDDGYFYVSAQLEEPDVWAKLTKRDAMIYHDNDFEVFIDPDGDTHQYYELEINAFGTEWDLFLVKPYRDGGPAINAWDIQGLETGVFVDGTLNEAGDRDRGWSVEIALPWSVLKEAANRPVPPEPGDQWRVNFSRVQWRTVVEGGEYTRLLDNPPGRSRPEDNWVWSPQGVINMHYPEMWGIVQFSDVAVGQGNDSVSIGDADRAKWVLRQVYYRQRSWFEVHGSFTGNLRALGLEATAWPIELEATADMYQATVVVGQRPLRIRQDGRVW
jgi:hypothetical protein